MIDIKLALIQAIDMLNQISNSARIDAELLLCHTLKRTRTYLYSHPEIKLSDVELTTYRQLITKRAQGIPIAYLTQTREFWSLPLKVTQDTLIPRPETEQLVELTLQNLANKSHATILELGTGSGAISLALAYEKPNWTIIATDKSIAALDIARQNATKLNLTNIQFLCSDWFDCIPTIRFDAIISNPPYIAEHDPHLQQDSLPFEPQQALTSGIDGLDALRLIIKQSHASLQPGGFLFLEHGYDQKNAVIHLFEQQQYKNIQCWQDYQGHDRISGGWR